LDGTQYEVQYFFDIESQFGEHRIERWAKEAHVAHATLYRAALASNAVSLFRRELQ
jgi:hypothetical protein